MGSKSDFPQILQKPARGTSQDDPCQMVRLIWVHVHVFASGRAKGCNTQSPMYTHTAERQPCQNKQQECKPSWIWKQGWGKCTQNAREPRKMVPWHQTPQGHFGPLPGPCVGGGNMGQNQNFPKIFQKLAEGTSKEAACPMAQRIWAKWSNGTCLRIAPSWVVCARFASSFSLSARRAPTTSK